MKIQRSSILSVLRDPRLHCCKGVALLLVLGCSGDGSVPDSIPVVPHIIGSLDITIGSSREGPEEHLFGRISGLAVDSPGTIYISDSQAGTIRVFDSAGSHFYDIGRRGAGPGEFRGSESPCCLRFDSLGRLWVTDRSRVQLFEVNTDSATPLKGIHLAVQPWPTPVMFAAGSRLVVRHLEGRSNHFTYLYFDTAGHELGRTPLLEWTPPDSIAGEPVMAGEIPTFVYPPFAPTMLEAHAPDGMYANARTSTEYRVAIYNADMQPIGTVRRHPDEGPLLTDAERDSANAHIRVLRQRFVDHGNAFPNLVVPDRKPILADMWYDRAGRLWIQISQPHRSPMARAEIYGIDGVLLFTAEWPAAIDLSHGAFDGTIAVGVHRDELDVETVARLRFR